MLGKVASPFLSFPTAFDRPSASVVKRISFDHFNENRLKPPGRQWIPMEEFSVVKCSFVAQWWRVGILKHSSNL